MAENIEIWDAVKQTKYKRTFDQLHDILANAKDDVDAAITSTLNVVCEISHSEAGTFWYYDKSGEGLIRARAVYGGADLSNIRLMPGEGIAGKTIDTGEPIITSDVNMNKEWTSSIDKKTNFDTKCMICVPLIARDSTFGCIQLLNKTDNSYFDDNDFELVVNLANEISKLCVRYNILIDEKDYSKVAVLSIGLSGLLEGSKDLNSYDIFKALKTYLSIIEEPIKKYNGTIDSFDYNNTIIYWVCDDTSDNSDEEKNEEDDEDYVNENVLKACKVASEIMDKRINMQNEIANKYKISFGVSAGVTYGPAYVGDIGTKTIAKHTIVGETINLAKFLKDEAEPGEIYVSEDAAREILPAVGFSSIKTGLFKSKKNDYKYYSIDGYKKR